MPQYEAKAIRCMWYNDVGWPRVNPSLQKNKIKPPVGCARSARECAFSHPSELEWDSARPSDVPPRYYGSRGRPETPVPPALRGQQNRMKDRDRTPERKTLLVKEEHLSPKLSFGPESESGTYYHNASNGRSGSRTPPPLPLPPPSRRASPPVVASSMTFEDRGRRDKRPFEWQDDRPGSSNRRDSSRRNSITSNSSRFREAPKTASSWRQDRLDDSAQATRSPNSLLSRIQTNGTHDHIDSDRRDGGMSPPPYRSGGRTPTQKQFKEPLQSDRGYEQYRERHRGRDNSFSEQYPANHKREDREPLTPPPRTTDSSSTDPPPPKGGIPPPPPPPTFSQSQNTQVNRPRLEIPPEKRREIWNERLTLLSEAVAARTAQQKALSDLATLQKLAERAQSRPVSRDAQNSLDKAVEAAKVKAETEKHRQASIVEKLFATDFWPIRVKREGSDRDGLLTDLDNMLEDLKSQVLTIAEEVNKNDRVLREVVTWIGSQSIKPSVVDIRNPAEPERGVKRRKLDADVTLDQPSPYESSSVSSSITLVNSVPEQLPTPVTTADFATPDAETEDSKTSSVTERVILVSSTLKQLETKMLEVEEREDEHRTQLQNLVDEAIKDFKDTYVKQKGDNYAKWMTEIKQDVEICGSDINELADTLAGVINDSVARNTEVNNLRAEINNRVSAMSELESNLAKERTELEEMRAACKQSMEEIKALTAAFKIQTAKAQESNPPMIPSIEDLAVLLEPQVKDSIRQDVMELMSNLRTEIVQLVQSQSVPLNPTFQEKMNKLARLPEVLMFLHNNGGDIAGALGTPPGASRPP